MSALAAEGSARQNDISDVSVVVPTFNRAAMLTECIESLLAQTRPPLEIIVIDDGSADATASLAAAFPATVRYFRKENGGKSSALNFALPKVRGRWVWFLDDDDVALPRSIEARLSALATQPDAALVVSRFAWGLNDASGHAVAGDALEWPDFSPRDFYPRFLRSCFIHLNGALVRRDRIAEVGGFRTDMLTSEDYEFTLRIARGATIAVCDEPTFIFRQHTGARGPANHRYRAIERERKFAEGDAQIGRWIRASHRMSEYLGLPEGQALDAVQSWDAVLARLLVMAGKGLLKEVAEDAIVLAKELDDRAVPVSAQTIASIKTAFQERYLALRMSEQPDLVRQQLAPLSAYRSGKAMRKAMARAILGIAWWQEAPLRNRARLARLAFRLA